jgi:hypothetical protein
MVSSSPPRTDTGGRGSCLGGRGSRRAGPFVVARTRLGRSLALPIVAALGLALLAGCAPKRDKTKPGVVTHTARDTSRILKGPPVRPKPGDLSDPCAARMHDLSGLLLLFYAVNKSLPTNLSDMASLADFDVEFHDECPVSGKPYTYVPQAIPLTGSDRFLVLYDSVPAHNGLRWGVFISPPKDGKPPATWVILMSEEVFRQYLPQHAE